MSDNKASNRQFDLETKVIIQKTPAEKNERRLPMLPSRHTEDTDIG